MQCNDSEVITSPLAKTLIQASVETFMSIPMQYGILNNVRDNRFLLKFQE